MYSSGGAHKCSLTKGNGHDQETISFTQLEESDFWFECEIPTSKLSDVWEPHTFFHTCEFPPIENSI